MGNCLSFQSDAQHVEEYSCCNSAQRTQRSALMPARSACGASCDHFEALPECLAASSAKGPLEPNSEAALRAAAMVPARGPSQAMLRNRLRSSGVGFVIPPEKQVSNGMCLLCLRDYASQLAVA